MSMQRLVCLVCALWVMAWPALAQLGGRDPTLEPPEKAADVSGGTGIEGMSIMVRDGKPHLVVGTRWYAVGDKVGTMRVERLSETEVWLHDGVKLIKIARFAGIQRTAIVAKPPCTVPPSAPPVTEAPSAAPPRLSEETLRAIGNARNDRPAVDAEAAQRIKKKPKVAKKVQTGVVDPAPQALPAVAPCEDSPT